MTNHAFSDKTAATAPHPARTIASVVPGPRRTITSFGTYGEAESAVDRLADLGFPVERISIVGTGLRSVERVTGRMTVGGAALVGAIAGVSLGVLLALLAGIFPWDSASGEKLAFGVVLGAVIGAVLGALVHEELSGGRRDFLSATRIEADRYDVQVDEDSAAEAARLLVDRPRPVVRR